MYDVELKFITDNETNNLTISGKIMNLFELNKKLKHARQKLF